MKKHFNCNILKIICLCLLITSCIVFLNPTLAVLADSDGGADLGGGSGSGSGSGSSGGGTKKIITKEITVDATKAELNSFRSEIDAIFAVLDSWKNNDSNFYKRYDGVVLKDAYTEVYYEPKDNSTDIKHVVHHPRFWIDISQTGVNNNYTNNWQRLRFDWKVTSGPSGAVEPNKCGSKQDSWTTDANNDTSHVEFYSTGDYTITRTPFLKWDINKRYDYTAHIMQGQTSVDTKYHTSTIYQSTQQGQDPKQTKTWKMHIASQDLYKYVEVNDTTTAYDADADVRIIQ